MGKNEILKLASWVKLEAYSTELGIDIYLINGQEVSVNEYRTVALILDNIEKEFGQ